MSSRVNVSVWPIIGMAAGSIMVIVSTLAGAMIKERALIQEAIEREYALYCPTDGKFAWVGECESE